MAAGVWARGREGKRPIDMGGAVVRQGRVPNPLSGVAPRTRLIGPLYVQHACFPEGTPMYMRPQTSATSCELHWRDVITLHSTDLDHPCQPENPKLAQVNNFLPLRCDRHLGLSNFQTVLF